VIPWFMIFSFTVSSLFNTSFEIVFCTFEIVDLALFLHQTCHLNLSQSLQSNHSQQSSVFLNVLPPVLLQFLYHSKNYLLISPFWASYFKLLAYYSHKIYSFCFLFCKFPLNSILFFLISYHHQIPLLNPNLNQNLNHFSASSMAFQKKLISSMRMDLKLRYARIF